MGAKAPALADLERVLTRLGLTYRAEEHHHPGHWVRKEGRVVVEWTESKETLIRKVAEKIGVKR